MAKLTALVIGASGIVGYNLSTYLVSQGKAWTVHGLARRPKAVEGVHAVAADLLQPESLKIALREIRPTHIYLCTWMRQATEAENIQVNGAMVRNLLDAVAPIGTVEHVALVTGLKHYLGPFETWGKGSTPATPFREEQGRLDVENFYYTQEDEVFAAAARDGFGWSVHRANTIIGYAVGNAIVTLAVYATICRETGRPFLFPVALSTQVDLTPFVKLKNIKWNTLKGTFRRDDVFAIFLKTQNFSLPVFWCRLYFPH